VSFTCNTLIYFQDVLEAFAILDADRAGLIPGLPLSPSFIQPFMTNTQAKIL
jgi:hypothetical protein